MTFRHCHDSYCKDIPNYHYLFTLLFACVCVYIACEL